MQKSPAWERISRFYKKTLIPAIFNIMKCPDYWTFTEVSSFDGNIIIRLHIYCHTTASRSQSVSPVKKKNPWYKSGSSTWNMKAKLEYYLFHLYSNVNRELTNHTTYKHYLFSSMDQYANAVIDPFELKLSK